MNGIFYSRTFAFIRGDNEFMRRLFSIFTAIVLAISLCGESSAQQAPAPLTKIEFSIVGVTMSVGPEYQAVPKGIASQVTTGFVSNGEPISPEISAMLPQDWRVTGELTGPTIPTPLTLTTTPGLPFQLPTFPLLGKYTLANIRVLDGTGKAIMAATPQSVTIGDRSTFDQPDFPVRTSRCPVHLDLLAARRNEFRGLSLRKTAGDLLGLLRLLFLLPAICLPGVDVWQQGQQSFHLQNADF